MPVQAALGIPNLAFSLPPIPTRAPRMTLFPSSFSSPIVCRPSPNPIGEMPVARVYTGNASLLGPFCLRVQRSATARSRLGHNSAAASMDPHAPIYFSGIHSGGISSGQSPRHPLEM
jgi:hypothetical protein